LSLTSQKYGFGILDVDLQHCAANAHSYSYAELHWITNPDPDSDPDPALFVSGFRKKKSEGKIGFFAYYLLL
jgi:hypothetical protein